ncbi:MAG: type II toxin-antitoxin system RelE family toxin [Bacteroidia bacterium]
MYQVVIKKSAAKELESLPKKVLLPVTQAIVKLSDNPRPAGCKKLKGQIENIWRIRVGDYRVVYEIKDTVKIVDIQKVGHRKDIYS